MPGLFYFTDVYPKISESFITREIQGVMRRGIGVELLALRRGEPTSAEASVLSPRVGYCRDVDRGRWRKAAAHLGAMRRSGSYLDAMRAARTRGLPHLGYLFKVAPLAARRVAQSGADRLHCHFGREGMLLGWLVSKLLDMPVSVTLHGSDVLRQPYGGLGRVLMDMDPVVTVSRHLRDAVVQGHSVPRSRIHLVRCGVDTGQFAFSPYSGDDLRILCVARLHRDKGIADLVEALAILRGRGLRFRCTIVGDGDERSRIEALIRERRLADRIDLAGAVPHAGLPPLYHRHSTFVLPSHSEGMGVVLLEAMACGLDVVATDVGGIPEVVEPEVHGHLVPPGNAAELAAAIEKSHRHRAASTDRRRRNRARIEDEFGLDSEIDRLVSLLFPASEGAR